MLEGLIDAADFVLEDFLRLPVRKALDPMVDDDFLVIVKRLSKAIRGVTGEAEAVALRKAINTLDVDWAELTPEQTQRIVQAANTAIRTTPIAWPVLEKVFRVESTRIIEGAKVHARELHELHIDVSLSATDKNVAEHAARSQTVYVRDQLGVRADAASKKAREIISKGLEAGKGREEIAGELADALQAQQLGRARSYYDVVSAAHVARARSYGSLVGYADAGIETFTFQAVMDEATTDACRFMHGRVFSVSEGLRSFEQAAELDDPEDIKTHSPWIQSGKDEDGQPILYTRTAGGGRNVVALIERSGLGGLADGGKFTTAHKDESLQAAGMSYPPLHGRCRSSIIPNVDL